MTFTGVEPTLLHCVLPGVSHSYGEHQSAGRICGTSNANPVFCFQQYHVARLINQKPYLNHYNLL